MRPIYPIAAYEKNDEARTVCQQTSTYPVPSISVRLFNGWKSANICGRLGLSLKKPCVSKSYCEGCASQYSSTYTNSRMALFHSPNISRISLYHTDRDTCNQSPQSVSMCESNAMYQPTKHHLQHTKEGNATPLLSASQCQRNRHLTVPTFSGSTISTNLYWLQYSTRSGRTLAIYAHVLHVICHWF